MISIEAKKRDTKDNLERLRAEGFVPAVFYGPKEKATSISVPEKELNKAWKDAGESTIVTIKVDGDSHDSLIHDIHTDPLTGKIKHADFYIIEKGKKISVHVPVEFEGVAPAVKDLGGILVKVLHEVEIEAMPKDLPHNLVVDISLIKDFDTHVTAGQIVLPSGVSLVTDPEEVVAMASQPKEEKEDESATIDLSAIEVEKKGKKEEESAE